MSLGTSRRQENLFALAPIGTDRRIDDLLRLQRAAQKINSILDLDLLLDRIVNDVAGTFGAVESSILLKNAETGAFEFAAIHGCTEHMKCSCVPLGRGLIGHVAETGEPIYVPNVDEEPRYIACEDDTHAELDIPLKVNDEVIGVFSIAHHEVDPFTPEQVDLLCELADHIAVAVQNARKYQREREQAEKLRREQEDAREIQQALLPKSSPLIPGIVIDGHSVPHGAVGGDWYDYVPLPDGKIALVLADVSGKGMPAALLMSGVRGMLRSLLFAGLQPEVALTKLNETILSEVPVGRYVTMVVAVFDPALNLLVVANAGHPSPILVAGDEIRTITHDCGIPLGMMAATYCPVIVELPKNFKLLLYSDGITEAENIRNEEFGVDRLTQTLLETECCIDTVFNRVREFIGSRPAGDDQTVVIMQSKPIDC
jgi:sigma-B regulation protein RsbU (phosphoserine phosphatase)